MPAQADAWQRDPTLSRLLIKQLLTDPVGLQWAATDEGVFRYDGHELLPLARLLAPGSAPAPRGQVFGLCLDAGGHLWVGADAGLFCLTLRTGGLPAGAAAPGGGGRVGGGGAAVLPPALRALVGELPRREPGGA